MEPNHMSVYAAHAIEYLIAVGYMLLFIPFWQYVMKDGAPARAPRRPACH